MIDHWFWLFLTVACVIWYSTITVFVAVKGIGDIRRMLRRLAESALTGKDEASENDKPFSAHK